MNTTVETYPVIRSTASAVVMPMGAGRGPEAGQVRAAIADALLVELTEAGRKARSGSGEFDRATLLNTVTSLANAVDARDRYTHSHSRDVAELAEAVGRYLGMGEEHLDLLRAAALLHDVGKIGAPDDVLGKRGELTASEWALVHKHPELGERIIAPAVDARILQWVRGHHERWDGTGYPDRLKGREIPLEARIIAICDAFNAMVSDRPYRAGRPRALAMVAITADAGAQFDPELVEVFRRAIDESDLATRAFSRTDLMTARAS